MEMELELKKGILIELLAFAKEKEFVNIKGLRLANKSKAERCYLLVQHSNYIDTKYFLPHCKWHTMLIEQCLDQLLAYW